MHSINLLVFFASHTYKMKVSESARACGSKDVTLYVSVSSHVDDRLLYYVAAAPPDYRGSFTGSGLPFADAEQAYHASPNVGTLELDGANTGVVKLLYPNAYYAGLGSVLVPSMVHFYYKSDGALQKHTHVIGKGVPYRALTYPAKRAGPPFYHNPDLPIRGQEAILRSGAYPALNAAVPANFWGARPPV